MTTLNLRPATLKIKQLLSDKGFRILNEIEPKRKNNLIRTMEYYSSQDARTQILLEIHNEGGYRLWFCNEGNDVQPDIDTINAQPVNHSIQNVMDALDSRHKDLSDKMIANNHPAHDSDEWKDLQARNNEVCSIIVFMLNAPDSILINNPYCKNK